MSIGVSLEPVSIKCIDKFHAFLPELFLVRVNSENDGRIAARASSGNLHLFLIDGTRIQNDGLRICDVFHIKKGNEIVIPLVFSGGLNTVLSVSVQCGESRGTAEMELTVKKGVRCRSTDKIVHIECLKELNIPIIARSSIQGVDLLVVLKTKGDAGNLLFEQSARSIEVELDLHPFESIECVKAMIDIGIRVTSDVPIDSENPTSKYSFTEVKSTPLLIRSSCTPELVIGQQGDLCFFVEQKLSSIPVKVAFKLMLNDKTVLIDGTVSGMATLVPGVNEFRFQFVPLVPGRLVLPGMEFECLPGGEKIKQDSGPTAFAHPVCSGLVVCQ